MLFRPLGLLSAFPDGHIFTGVPETVRMHLSIGTSLAAIIPTCYRAHNVRIAHRFSRKGLELAFGAYLLLIAGRFAWSFIS